VGLTSAKVGLDLVRVGKPLAFDAADQARIKEYLARYPSDQRDSAIMPALWLAQKRFGFISEEAIELVAKSLEVSEADVAAVASFYTMYNLAPTGRHIVQVCCTLSCSLMGAERIVRHIEKKLGIGAGETTKDGKFTLKKVECLAACGMAPMLQINEERYHYNLTESEVDRILDSLS
jgi:NADH-quinone oxidoreductase subunit E